MDFLGDSGIFDSFVDGVRNLGLGKLVFMGLWRRDGCGVVGGF